MIIMREKLSNDKDMISAAGHQQLICVTFRLLAKFKSISCKSVDDFLFHFLILYVMFQ